MNNLQAIESEILKITTDIETNYPELYAFLNENPTTIPTAQQSKITTSDMADYLESLKQMLKHHIETRQKKNNYHGPNSDIS